MPEARFSDWIEYSYLSDSQICSWLKENYNNNNDLELTERIEDDILSSRDSKNVRYFFCRYGHNVDNKFGHDELLFAHEKFNRDQAVALAANKHFFDSLWADAQAKVFRQLIDGFPKTEVVLQELFKNPSIDRDTFTELLEERKKIPAFENPVFLNFFLNSLVESPSVKEKYDNTYLDGFLDYRFGKFNTELQKVIMDLPVAKTKDEVIKVCEGLTEKEAKAFEKDNQSLLETNANLVEKLFKLDCATNTDQDCSFLLKLLKKWRFKTATIDDLEYYLCYECVGSFLKNFRAGELNSEKILDGSAALRHAFHRYGKFDELFGFPRSALNSADMNIYFRSYVDNQRKSAFSPEMESRMTELGKKEKLEYTEQLELKILKNYKTDTNEFVGNICFNKDFYEDEHLTELMEQIVWDFPINDLDMRYPNDFRSMVASKTNFESPKFDSTLAIKELNQQQEKNEELLASVKTDITNLTEELSTLGHQVSQLSADLKTNADEISSKIDEEKSITNNEFSKQERLLETYLDSYQRKLTTSRSNTIELLRRLIIAVIWICGVLTSLVLAIGSFQADNGGGTLIVLLLSVACLGLTWFLSKVINWVFLEQPLN